MANRKRDYIDLYFSDKDLRKLKKGYTVLKHHNGINIAIHRNPHDRKTVRLIEKYKAKIKSLEGRKVKHG